MVAKKYKWADGATLEDHSRRKHKILREYFYQYLVVRCQIPQQARMFWYLFAVATRQDHLFSSTSKPMGRNGLLEAAKHSGR